jgi:hypothetical protein
LHEQSHQIAQQPLTEVIAPPASYAYLTLAIVLDMAAVHCCASNLLLRLPPTVPRSPLPAIAA